MPIITNNTGKVAAHLKKGGVAAFPTETVYGLAADAENPRAVADLYRLKNRPSLHPAIVHLADFADFYQWAKVPPSAEILARKFLPGPLTMILNKSPKVLDSVTGSQNTVGLRSPANSIAQKLLREFGGGLAAPSANRFGRLSPTAARHVLNEFKGESDLMILENDQECTIGIESTIIDLSGDFPAVLRPGAIAAAEISRTLGVGLAIPSPKNPRAPGGLKKHYAPQTPIALADENEIEKITAMHPQKRIGVLSRRRPPSAMKKLWRCAPISADDYRRRLYATLHELDDLQCDLIVAESPPSGEDWEAVRDRLRRAANSN